MAGLLDSVDQRTRLAGHNRLELLLFKLDDTQTFGINVFKVQEVIHCPSLTRIPNSHPVVSGVANMRGKTISVIDLARAVGKPAIENPQDSFVIITEYNRVVQGFLVHSVDRIINVNWEGILPPPKGSGSVSYLTAVTKVDNNLVEILDVEKILSEIVGFTMDISDEVKEGTTETEEQQKRERPKRVLVADDSAIARKQIKRTLDQIDVECVMAQNGAEALKILQEMAEKGDIHDQISLVISDIEMPEMDGYTLTTEIRRDPRLDGLYVMLHTSLSGVFNNAMVEQVGANNFIAKFCADELATGVFQAIHESRDDK
jgi:two-component system chemotaxis response regulator CheV